MSVFSRREGHAHGYENGQDDARKVLVQAVENVKAQTHGLSDAGSHIIHHTSDAVLREYDILMRETGGEG